MPTLDELQELDDGQFHSLCDDLLRRLELRYRRLRTRGLTCVLQLIGATHRPSDGRGRLVPPPSHVGFPPFFLAENRSLSCWSPRTPTATPAFPPQLLPNHSRP